MQDPNYRVEGVPPSIRGKITQLMNATHDAAFSGMHDPDVSNQLIEYEKVCRYNLERTILTEIAKATRKKKGARK